MEQVVQKDGQKTWKGTKFQKGFSCCHNCVMQNNGGLNSLKNH
jgi:hypothetical protein